MAFKLQQWVSTDVLYWNSVDAWKSLGGRKLCASACVCFWHMPAHTHTQSEYFMCRVTALVRSHKCHPASFARALSLSLSLRCSGEANELSLQMKPSSITTHTHTFFFFLFSSCNHFESTEQESGDRKGGRPSFSSSSTHSTRLNDLGNDWRNQVGPRLLQSGSVGV